ncbi:MAG: DUF2007 domain-containing protein [Bacteroidetes bacterium]|nr:DUF2007 domain-containing protein [Bacteroidota bacterium]MBI3482178.1 DUF2007 domain-containing protein [Bacteroidota bacterium]
MTEPQEKIIVFRSYDTIVEANLAKTKLDAYGIPCFLTDEHLTNLYPIQNAIFPGARLHIFERDADEVRSLLEEGIELKDITCSKCGSDYYESIPAWRKMYFSLLMLLELSPSTTEPKDYHCKNCGNYF